MALKSRSHVVGFLGDGINDAPSLHSADVGILVANAVDVAEDAAEIILLQPGLGVLHSGIVEGRKAFGNVMKYLLIGTSSNFGNMFSMAGAAVFLPFLPMLPTQILLNNFLYDFSQLTSQLTIPTDNVDLSYSLKPQHWNIRLVRNFMLMIGPISSIYDFLTFFVLLKIFHSAEMLFHTGRFVESLATQTLVLFILPRPRLLLTRIVKLIVHLQSSETVRAARTSNEPRESDYARQQARKIHFRTSSAASIMAAKGRMKSHALAPIGAVPRIGLPSGV